MNYIPVLVCSSTKIKDYFHYREEVIRFVSPPAPDKLPNDIFTYHCLDDEISGENKTWRELIVNGQNYPGLDVVKAYLLYRPKIYPDIYRDFYKTFGNRFYILSAGWGIIRADYKIPAYDIAYSTFSNMLNHLKEDYVKYAPNSEVILFAGKDYLLPFRNMTQSIPYKKTIVVYHENSPDKKGGFFKNSHQGGFYYLDYYTNNPLNWHYRAAQEFLRLIQKRPIP